MDAISSTIFAAAIGAGAVILGGAITPSVGMFFENAKNNKIKKQIAIFAQAELITLRRHSEANLIKLNSLKEKETIGDKIDFVKLKYFDKGFNMIDPQKIYMLHPQLAQDLLRMMLYTRNNNFEITNAIDLIFNHDRCCDLTKFGLVNKLISRTETTIIKIKELSDQLKVYSKSPSKYKNKSIDWPDDLFKYQGN